MTDSATALLNLQRYFGFRSIREMAQATGIERSALTRAMNTQKPRKLARESRLRLARFLSWDGPAKALNNFSRPSARPVGPSPMRS